LSAIQPDDAVRAEVDNPKPAEHEEQEEETNPVYTTSTAQWISSVRARRTSENRNSSEEAPQRM